MKDDVDVRKRVFNRGAIAQIPVRDTSTSPKGCISATANVHPAPIARLFVDDTTVVADEEILGQPESDEDARRMLRLLSGRWHEVVTGVALVRAGAGQVLIDHETTRVLFAEMSAEEIDWYVSTGEPKGKAGAYGIQGKAALFIKEIKGDYFNVVGLPVRLVFELMRRT